MRCGLLTAYLIGTLGLAACHHGTAKHSVTTHDPLLPLPPLSRPEPSDSDLESAVRDYLARAGAPAESRFEFARMDLDGDGWRDGIVYLTTPYRHWCEMHGCTALILRAAGSAHFEPVGIVRPARPPFYIGASVSNGWHDLIVRLDGRWSETRYVALQHNGHGYPRTPENAPPCPHPPTDSHRLPILP